MAEHLFLMISLTKSKMAATASGGAAGLSRSRIKPEIYRTDTGKIIVEDEFLNFIFIKIKTMKQDEIVSIAVDHFGSEWIANSTKVLFELCPGSTRKLVAHTGAQKDLKNVKSCLKLLNEVGDAVPRFVCHHLDELPPVTFNSLDVSCLLGRIEQLSVDITSMKQAVSLQTNNCNDLRIVTTDLTKRLGAVEQHSRETHGLQTKESEKIQRAATPQAIEKTQHGVQTHVDSEDFSQREENSTAGLEGSTRPEKGPHTKWSEVAATPPWTLVEGGKRSNNRHKQIPENAAVKSNPRLNPSRGKKTGGIVGTSTAGNIQVIKTKLVSVFATKFSPDLDAETLTSYMKDKLKREVTCHKIDTVQSRFSSFKITAECNEVEEMYNPTLWPEGIFVRRFYEPRQPRPTQVMAPGVNVPVLGDGARDAWS